MRRTLFALASVLTLLSLVAGNALAHGGGGGGGGGGGHGGGGGFGGGGHGGGFGGGGFGGGHYGGGGGFYGGGMSGGHYSGGGMGSGHMGGSGMSGGAVHSGGGALGSTGHLGGSGLNHAGHSQAPFVHNHAQHIAGNHVGQHTVNHSGNFNHLNHQNYGHSYWRNRSYFFGFYSPFGLYLGYPWWWNYGNRFGYGYGGYGYGYGGYGYGYGGYGYAYQPNCLYYGYGQPGAATVAVQDQNIPPTDQLENSLDYAGQGEVAFKAGKYQDAIQNWRHALVDDPRNGAIILLLGQALFAAGQYDEAAGATQAAMQLLPQDKWGTVVIHYKELYSNIQDYTNQLRALEKERLSKPDSPGLRFLLGYHFGYLGYPKQAVRELDKALEFAPKDEIAKKLRDEFSAKLEGAEKPKPGDAEPPVEKLPEKSAQDKAEGTDA
jgi:hypothetical protein